MTQASDDVTCDVCGKYASNIETYSSLMEVACPDLGAASPISSNQHTMNDFANLKGISSEIETFHRFYKAIFPEMPQTTNFMDCLRYLRKDDQMNDTAKTLVRQLPPAVRVELLNKFIRDDVAQMSSIEDQGLSDSEGTNNLLGSGFLASFDEVVAHDRVKVINDILERSSNCAQASMWLAERFDMLLRWTMEGRYCLEDVGVDILDIVKMCFTYANLQSTLFKYIHKRFEAYSKSNFTQILRVAMSCEDLRVNQQDSPYRSRRHRDLKYLIDLGADPDTRDPKGNTLLHLFSQSNGLHNFERSELLDLGQGLNCFNHDMDTPIHTALEKIDCELSDIRDFVKHDSLKAVINSKNALGYTPWHLLLIRASHKDHLGKADWFVERMVNAGADKSISMPVEGKAFALYGLMKNEEVEEDRVIDWFGSAFTEEYMELCRRKLQDQQAGMPWYPLKLSSKAVSRATCTREDAYNRHASRIRMATQRTKRHQDRMMKAERRTMKKGSKKHQLSESDTEVSSSVRDDTDVTPDSDSGGYSD